VLFICVENAEKLNAINSILMFFVNVYNIKG